MVNSGLLHQLPKLKSSNLLTFKTIFILHIKAPPLMSNTLTPTIKSVSNRSVENCK